RRCQREKETYRIEPRFAIILTTFHHETRNQSTHRMSDEHYPCCSFGMHLIKLGREQFSSFKIITPPIVGEFHETLLIVGGRITQLGKLVFNYLVERKTKDF